MILQRPSFERAYRKLPAQDQARVVDAIARVESGFGRPHAHSALGIRPFGRFIECRAGLKLRILFVRQGADLVLVTVGDHDDLRAYVKGTR